MADSRKIFEIGEVVEHKLTNDYMMILAVDETKEEYICRLKNYQVIGVKYFEIRERGRKK